MRLNFKKKAGFLWLCGTLLATWSMAQTVNRTPQGIKCRTQGMDITIEFYSPSIVRVYKEPAGTAYDKKSLVIVQPAQKVQPEYSEEGSAVVLTSATLQIRFNPVSGSVDFYDAEGKHLLKDKDYGTSFEPKDDAGTPSYQVNGSFLLEKEEPIYGIGQVMDGRFDRRNSRHHLQNENMFTYSPYFMSPTKGYAVYWDNYSISEPVGGIKLVRI